MKINLSVLIFDFNGYREVSGSKNETSNTLFYNYHNFYFKTLLPMCLKYFMCNLSLYDSKSDENNNYENF